MTRVKLTVYLFAAVVVTELKEAGAIKEDTGNTHTLIVTVPIEALVEVVTTTAEIVAEAFALAPVAVISPRKTTVLDTAVTGCTKTKSPIVPPPGTLIIVLDGVEVAAASVPQLTDEDATEIEASGLLRMFKSAIIPSNIL